MNGKEIQELRHTLGESTTQFGARFARTRSAVEQWERGRRAPDPLIERILITLWNETFPKKRKKHS